MEKKHFIFFITGMVLNGLLLIIFGAKEDLYGCFKN